MALTSVSLNCLFITCSAGRMRFSRIIPSSIGQDHIPTSEGRQPLLQPIFTPGIRCLRIHCGSVMVSKFTTLWRSGVPCLALSHYRLTIFPRVKTGWMLLPTIVMRYTGPTIFLCNTYFTLTRFGLIVVTWWHCRTFFGPIIYTSESVKKGRYSLDTKDTILFITPLMH